MSHSAFFAKYKLRDYNPATPILDEFERLSTVKNWAVGGKVYRKRRRELLHSEFEAHYGSSASKLESWQVLCRDVGIDTVPPSITKCKKVRQTRNEP